MRTRLLVALLLLSGIPCAEASPKKDWEKTTACYVKLRETPLWKAYQARFFTGDNDMTLEKLQDQRTLTAEEGQAILALNVQSKSCEGLVTAWFSKYNPQALPALTRANTRWEAIDLKVATGEIPVGAANRLFMEVHQEFQNESATLQGNASAQAAQNKQRLTTSVCSMIGSSLICTTQ